MPTKRKFTARFPTAKIKRIMQVDEDVGKISATVPSVVSCALETCISQLVTKAYELALSRNSRTVTPSHLKQVIEELAEFEFAKDLVRDVAALKPVKPGTGASGDSLDNGDCCMASDLPGGGSISCLDNHNHVAMSSHSSSCGGPDSGVSKKRGRPKKAACPSPLTTLPAAEKKRRRTGLSAAIKTIANPDHGGNRDRDQSEPVPVDLCTAPVLLSPPELQIAIDTDSSTD